MLFSIIDDFRWASFWLSLAALVMWAAQTGFGARLLIMFSDISFYENMPKEEGAEKQKKQSEIEVRIAYRKRLASLVPRVLFMVPFIIMGVGYIVAFFTYDGKYAEGYKWANRQMFIAVLGIIITTGFVSYHVLYKWFYRNQLENRMDEATKRKIRALYKTDTLKELGIIRPLLFAAVGLSVLCIISYSFFPVSWMQELGSVHLITMSFGCWIAVLYFIAYLDKRIPYLFLKYILFAVILWMSYIDTDHPVRIQEGTYKAPSQGVVAYFDNWFKERFESDTASVPIFFVSAEGGACRSGYWTSLVLAQLEDAMPGFTDHVFSYSSVSGGTLGVNVFNAIHEWKKASGDTLSYMEAVQRFYEKDFLAPVTGRMVFGEAFNLFSPCMFQRFDRATSLEQSWEESFEELSSDNFMKKHFNETTGSGGPAVFINSTEIETGKRSLMSNVMIDSFFFNDAVSLQSRLNANINYSTAILFSARFPYFSPAAAIQSGDNSTRRHYVDGGYFENMGNITTMEIINAVKGYANKGKQVKPYVLLLTNDEPFNIKPLLLGNGALEPPLAFLKVRGGHTNHSYIQLQKFVCGKEVCGGGLIQLNMGLKGNVVPMNWFISANAKRAVDNLFIQDEPYKQGISAIAKIMVEYKNAPMLKN
jgi:hypothetical protein